MVLFWSLSRLDSKSLERASMDYEAPLMPCGCILLLGGWSAHGESEAKEGGTRGPAKRGWKRDR